MECLSICGAKKLYGKINVQGSKNSSLPILASAFLTGGECVIHNCPLLSDVRAACDILSHLGCRVRREGKTVTVDSSCASLHRIPEGLMHEMRSSIVFLGPVLSRMRRAELYMPGGCEIGLRPIDLHLSSLRALGAVIEEKDGRLSCSAPNGLHGCNITLAFPSVGATENAVIAASVCDGVTNIFNAAREPEIKDTVDFLNACGAKIHINDDNTITVCGVKRLHGCEYTVIPDRIAASTYLSCVAACGGDVLLENAVPEHIEAVISVLRQMGCILETNENSVRIKREKRLKNIKAIKTMPYPGFPTDAQSPLMAAMCLAEGEGTLTENIFESRFKHVPALIKMGADIKLSGRTAIINGKDRLFGAEVGATDLRGGGALVTAALAAYGESTVTSLHHLDRGYESIEKNLREIGADIKRGIYDAGKGKRLP